MFNYYHFLFKYSTVILYIGNNKVGYIHGLFCTNFLLKSNNVLICNHHTLCCHRRVSVQLTKVQRPRSTMKWLRTIIYVNWYTPVLYSFPCALVNVTLRCRTLVTKKKKDTVMFIRAPLCFLNLGEFFTNEAVIKVHIYLPLKMPHTKYRTQKIQLPQHLLGERNLKNL